LGSKYFDSSLIEPIRRIIADSPLAFDQTAPNFNPRDPPQTDKNSNSQPGIGRKTYHLSNQARKIREMSKG